MRTTLPLCLAFAAAFGVLYGGASYLTGLHGIRHRVYFDWELSLPFVPAAALLYLSLNVLLCMAPFVLRTREAFLPLFRALMLETAIGAACFLLFPVARGFPPRSADGAIGAVFDFANAVNLEFNEVPSLHVALAFTAAIAYGQRCARAGRLALLAWATAIASSSVFMHEHHLVDVLTGLALALVTCAALLRRF